MVTASQVKELREKTGAGMMDCKKVLTETDGDMEKAIELLRERGIAKAAKKSSRVAAEGLVAAYVSDDKKVGAVVEVNAETDFVSKNDEFKTFVNDVARQIVEKNPANVEELLAQPSIAESGKTVQEVLTNKIATIGENMTIRRFARFESTGIVASYIHGEGKIGVLVDMENATPELAKDICMQIAAAKPAEIAEKMVQGRINKFYGEICLLEQPFVKDPDIKINKLLESKGAKINNFARLEKGEGIEKVEENFAEEVAKQIKG